MSPWLPHGDASGEQQWPVSPHRRNDKVLFLKYEFFSGFFLSVCLELCFKRNEEEVNEIDTRYLHIYCIMTRLNKIAQCALR